MNVMDTVERSFTSTKTFTICKKTAIVAKLVKQAFKVEKCMHKLVNECYGHR